MTGSMDRILLPVTLKKIPYYSVHLSLVIYKLWLLLRGLVAVAVVERWPLSRGLDENVCKDHLLRRTL